MTRRRPTYCPYCGAALVTRVFEGRDRRFCSACDEFVFQNPVPVARVVVLDGERALFVKRAQPPHQGAWTIPGGVLEIDESAAQAATRELTEETNVRAAPAAVELVHTDLRVDDPADGSILTICFAIDRDRTNGAPVVGDEPAAVAFWTPTELTDSSERVRPLDLRCLEAAFDHLRGEPREFTPES